MKNFSNDYLKLLKGEFQGLNLTRILDEDTFFNKQVLDSIEPLRKCSAFKESVDKTKILVDIGFGGGFPILPLAKNLPDVTFIGFEARRKKVLAVSQIAQQLGLENVKLYHRRLEEILFNLPVVITFKAVGKVKEYLSLINTTKPLTVVFYKGPNFTELEDPSDIPSSWELLEKISIHMPHTEGREIVVYQTKNVPCGTIKTDKNLVNLTTFL